MGLTRLTHKRESGMKSGYWSPNRKEELVEKLAEYEDLEEQGKLLKPPCAAGDTIYHVCIPKNDEPQIIEMKVGCVEPCGAVRNYKGTCEVWNV